MMPGIGQNIDQAGGTDGIVSLDDDRIDEDLLYELCCELGERDERRYAGRMEIERRNLITYSESGYQPTFTRGELLEIGVILLKAREQYADEEMADRVSTLERFGQVVVDSIDRVTCSDDEDEIVVIGTVDVYGGLAGDDAVQTDTSCV